MMANFIVAILQFGSCLLVAAGQLSELQALLYLLLLLNYLVSALANFVYLLRGSLTVR